MIVLGVLLLCMSGCFYGDVDDAYFGPSKPNWHKVDGDNPNYKTKPLIFSLPSSEEKKMVRHPKQ